MSINFKTIKLDAENLLEVKYKEVVGKATKISEQSWDKPVSEALVATMKKLAPHFAIICEEIELPVELKDVTPESIEPFTVRGFHRGGNEEMPGVTIVGHKKLKSGKILGLNAPFLKFKREDSKDNGNFYPHESHLQGVLAEIEILTEDCVEGKGFKPDPQLDLYSSSEDNGDTSKTTVAVLEPEEGSAFDEKPKGKGKKKAVVTE